MGFALPPECLGTGVEVAEEAHQVGVAGSERDVSDAFEEIFTSTEGKLVVALFSSSVYRMQILVDLAVQFERKVAFVGRGMIQSSQIGQRLGCLSIAAGLQIRDSEVPAHPADKVLGICTHRT